MVIINGSLLAVTTTPTSQEVCEAQAAKLSDAVCVQATRKATPKRKVEV
jgi:hypothetical protein